MNDKKIIETYKTVRTVERSQPQALPREAIEDLKRMIDDELAHANPQNRDARSLAEIVDAIENDENKSLERKEFELRISRIADRIKDQLSEALPVSLVYGEPPQPKAHERVNDDSETPLHELLKELRQRLNY